MAAEPEGGAAAVGETAEPPPSPPPPQDDDAARRTRFTLLAAYSLANFLCAGAWNTLAPLLEVAQARFQVGPSAVGFVAQSLFLTYVPGSILALYLTERCGLRATLLVGAASQTLMCVLKWLGALLSNYALLLVGQLVGGLGQPLLLNVVSRLTFDWRAPRSLLCAPNPPPRFPPEEREWATLVGYQSSNAGAILFNALPAWVVREPKHLAPLFAWQLLAWLPSLALLRAALPADRPARPPCAAAALQWRMRAEARWGGASALRLLAADVRALLRSPDFLLLAALFSCVAGPSWALPAVEGQMMGACGYSAQQAGGAGAVQLAAGVVTCALLVPLLRAGESAAGGGGGGGRDYLSLQRALALACAAATAVLLAATRPLGARSLLAAWALFGAAQGPMGPVTLEHAAEISFPIAPDSSSALLFILSNVASFAQTATLQWLLRRGASAHCTSPATPAAAFLMALMAAGCACGFAMKRAEPAASRAEGLELADMPSPAAESPAPS